MHHDLLSARGLWLALVSIALGACATAQTPAAPKEDDRPVEDASKQQLQERSRADLPTVWLIGDSTVKVGTSGQQGWGEAIGQFFDPAKVNVVNRAIGGRSSRTFLTDGRWDRILEELRAGDVVIMQFGHNDGGPINEDPPVNKSTRSRGTIKGTGDESVDIVNVLKGTPETVHSYGWYLRKYVRDTEAKGAAPVVCSLVPRKIWQDGRIARGKGSYADWAREVAVQEGAWFIDLHEIIARAYERVGQEKVEEFFADARTHTTPTGAEFSARCVIAGLTALPGDPFDQLLSEEGRNISPAPADTVIAAGPAK